METQQILHAGAVPRGAPVLAGIPNVVAGPFGLPALHRLKARYVEDWTLLHLARRMAARRHRQKHIAGMVALTVMALGAGLSAASQIFFRPQIAPHLQDVLACVALLSSGLALMIGLSQLSQSHSTKARYLEACAQALDELARRLAAASLSNESQLTPYLARYEAVMERCEADHGEVDLHLAEMMRASDDVVTRGMTERDEAVVRRRRRIAQLRYHLDAYGAYGVLALSPPAIGVAVWWLQPVASLMAGI